MVSRRGRGGSRGEPEERRRPTTDCTDSTDKRARPTGFGPDPARLLVLSVSSVPSVVVPFPGAASAVRRAEARRQSESEKSLTNRNGTPMIHPAGETDAGSSPPAVQRAGNPNAETRNPREHRSTNKEQPKRRQLEPGTFCHPVFAHSDFAFRICFGSRASDSEFPASPIRGW